ncbi:hypothetical protein IFM89_012822, partial [Coptis chinensis]
TLITLKTDILCNNLMENTRVTLTAVLRAFSQTDRDSFWLSYPSCEPTYKWNVNTYAEKEYISLFNEACLVSPHNTVRFGSVGQAIIKAIRLHHIKNNTAVGTVANTDAISFECGVYTKAYLSPEDYTANEMPALEHDYTAVKTLIQLFEDYFNIVPDEIPNEILSLKSLLDHPQGYTDHILNHYCLWSSTRRRDFVYMLDALIHHPEFRREINTALEGLEDEHPYFDFQYYIAEDSVIHERYTYYQADPDDSSFLNLFHFIRNTFHHGQNHMNFLTIQQIEYDLHQTFPFAFDMLCLELGSSNFLQRSCQNTSLLPQQPLVQGCAKPRTEPDRFNSVTSTRWCATTASKPTFSPSPYEANANASYHSSRQSADPRRRSDLKRRRKTLASVVPPIIFLRQPIVELSRHRVSKRRCALVPHLKVPAFSPLRSQGASSQPGITDPGREARAHSPISKPVNLRPIRLHSCLLSESSPIKACFFSVYRPLNRGRVLARWRVPAAPVSSLHAASLPSGGTIRIERSRTRTPRVGEESTEETRSDAYLDPEPEPLDHSPSLDLVNSVLGCSCSLVGAIRSWIRDSLCHRPDALA